MNSFPPSEDSVDEDPPSDLGPSARLGKYEIIKRLAVGGMAEIYLARTGLARTGALPGLEKILAIKRILPHLAGKRHFVDMFLDEARIAATLQHPNIVQVYDVGMVNGSYFMAMEYLHGRDLNAIMRRLASLGRRLPIDLAVQIVEAVCAGLHYAHEKLGFDGQPLHVVHRDVSPQNVIVTFEGAVKLLDFGIAKATNRLGRTQFGTLKGKSAYMSPEQCRSEKLDRRSDIFSAGVLLYELSLSRRLFRAESEFETMKKVVEGAVPPPRELDPAYPPSLERVVMKALNRERDRRHQTALELQQNLQTVAKDLKLYQSQQVLRSFMADSFGAALEAWREAERQGVSLADHLRTALPEPPVEDSADDSMIVSEEPLGDGLDEPTSQLIRMVEEDSQDDVVAVPSQDEQAFAQTPVDPPEAAGMSPPPAGPPPRGGSRIGTRSAVTDGALGASTVAPRAPRLGGGESLLPVLREPPLRTGEIRIGNVEVVPPESRPSSRRGNTGVAASVLMVAAGLLLGLGIMLVLISGARIRDGGAGAATVGGPATSALGLVNITTEPPGATLFLDGQRRAESSPVTIDRLPLGKHVLFVQREGYEDAIERFELRERDVALVRIKLTAVAGSPSGGAPKGAPIAAPVKPPAEIVAKEPPREIPPVKEPVRTQEPAAREPVVKPAPVEPRRPPEPALQLSAVKAVAPRRSSASSSKSKAEGDPAAAAPAIAPPLSPTQGLLALESRPSCKAMVDGVVRGQTPIRVVLPVGVHTVRLTNPSLGIDETMTVHVMGRMVVRKEVEFQ